MHRLPEVVLRRRRLRDTPVLPPCLMAEDHVAPSPPLLGNRLLDALPAEIRAALAPHFTTIDLPFEAVIHEPGAKLEHALFPTEGMISVIAAMGNGALVEIGIIGNDGMLGVSLVLGDERPPQMAMVQMKGRALQIESDMLLKQVAAFPALQKRLLRYAQANLSSTAQSVACNRLHLLEQRCARWLLVAHDRSPGDTLHLTHELLSIMLGVRRPGVTVAAQALQSAGVISYNHGEINILDRQGLEAASCECYRANAEETARLMA